MQGQASSKGEDGAVLVIVVLSLVALFGMTTLVVDVGGALYARRGVVNASDSAALAAAISCAQTADLDVPESIADEFALANLPDVNVAGANIVSAINCDTGRSGRVTVGYGKQQQLFFAPVLGFGNEANVATMATAAWSGAGSASILPIVLNLGVFHGDTDCSIPDVPLGAECYLWYDNDRFVGSAFGFLDLRQADEGWPEDEIGWDVDRDAQCPRDVDKAPGTDQLRNWINGIDLPTVNLNFPDPTYVCVVTGLSSSTWQTVDAVAARRGIVDLAVNYIGPGRPVPEAPMQGQVLRNQSSQQIHKYDIIGFARMQFLDMLTVKETGALAGTCTDKFSTPYPADSYIPWSAFSGSECPGTVIPDSVVNVTFAATNPPVVSWDNYGMRILSGTLPRNSNVTFEWSKGGSCGDEPPPNASSRCLRIKWLGAVQVEDTVHEGADLGMYTVRLIQTTP
jgi:hypothetical protein